MSRTQKHPHRVTPIAPSTTFTTGYISALRVQEFSRRLKTMMSDQKLSQSDLARLAFGPEKDDSESCVPKGRDRISAYVRGRQFPDPINLEKIAQALGVDKTDLIPEPNSQTCLVPDPEFNIHKIPNSTRGIITLQAEMEMEVIAQIMAIYVTHADKITNRVVARPANPTPNQVVAAPANPAPKRSQEIAKQAVAAPDAPKPKRARKIEDNYKAKDENLVWKKSFIEDPLDLASCIQE